jgi:hypothetical protein
MVSHMKPHTYFIHGIALVLTLLVADISYAGDISAQRPSKPAKVLPFDVTVSLAPDTAKKMAGIKETIIVAAYFYGDPIPEAESKADADGEIHFGTSKKELSGAGVARITPIAIDPKMLKLIQGGEVMVLINVFSGRRSVQNNILHCDLFQDRVARAASEGVKINCTLL